MALARVGICMTYAFIDVTRRAGSVRFVAGTVPSSLLSAVRCTWYPVAAACGTGGAANGPTLFCSDEGVFLAVASTAGVVEELVQICRLAVDIFTEKEAGPLGAEPPLKHEA